MCKIFRLFLDEGQRYSQTAVNVGFLRGNPAEVIKSRQTAVFNNEIQTLEVGCSDVDISNIKRIAVQRQDGRALNL